LAWSAFTVKAHAQIAFPPRVTISIAPGGTLLVFARNQTTIPNAAFQQGWYIVEDEDIWIWTIAVKTVPAADYSDCDSGGFDEVDESWTEFTLASNVTQPAWSEIMAFTPQQGMAHIFSAQFGYLNPQQSGVTAWGKKVVWVTGEGIVGIVPTNDWDLDLLFAVDECGHGPDHCDSLMNPDRGLIINNLAQLAGVQTWRIRSKNLLTGEMKVHNSLQLNWNAKNEWGPTNSGVGPGGLGIPSKHFLVITTCGGDKLYSQHVAMDPFDCYDMPW